MEGNPSQFIPNNNNTPFPHDTNNGSTSQEESGQPLVKKPRFSYEPFPLLPPQTNVPVSARKPPLLPPLLLLPPPQNRRTSIFFKTRTCMKNKNGYCPLGDKCTFAHGQEELRKLPPNWQGIVNAKESIQDPDKLQKIYIHGICKLFYQRNECPFGDRCTFRHVSRDEFDKSLMPSSSNTEAPEAEVHQRMAASKTELCHKREGTGVRVFGNECQYDHGIEELKQSRDHVELDTKNVRATPADVAGEDSTKMMQPPKMETRLLKLPKKIIGIYGDWLDEYS